MRELSQQASQFMMKTNRLIIIRHGESEFNRLNLFCGWHDSPLSQEGADEARCVAAANLTKEKFEFDVVYTSLLCRSRHTAHIIMREMNCSYLPIVSDWRLNERHYGDLTGYNKRKMMECYGEEQLLAWRRGFECVPPEIKPSNPYYYSICNNPSFADVPADQFPFAESMSMCAKRVLSSWEEIKQEVMKGKRVLICTHGTVTRSLIMHIEGLSSEEIKTINIPNSVPCVYEFDLKTGNVLGSRQLIGDPEYIKKKTAKVASIGK